MVRPEELAVATMFVLLCSWGATLFCSALLSWGTTLQQKTHCRQLGRDSMDPAHPEPPSGVPTGFNASACLQCPAVPNWKKPFSYVHISKSGGTHFIEWMQKHRAGEFYPGLPWGQEHGFLYDVSRRPNMQHLVMVREPREHLWSMYAQCRYGASGSGLHKHGHLFHDSTPDKEGFSRWLVDYCRYRESRAYQEKMYGKWLCYYPNNYQAHALTSGQANSHSPFAKFHRKLKPGNELIPNFEAVLSALQQMAWVGVTDFFDASVCLLIGSATNPTKDIQDHLQTQCRCPTSPKHISSKHGHVRQFKYMEELDNDVLACADALTNIDIDMMKVVVPKFLQLVVNLEMRLKRRVLCDENLQAMQPKYEHIIRNVTALYMFYREQFLECCPPSTGGGRRRRRRGGGRRRRGGGRRRRGGGRRAGRG